jgi:ribosomal protein S18 acetylase RimI-like enzyme
MVQIRFARLEDAQAIAELHTESWRYAYRGALSDEYLSGDIIADRLKLWQHRLSEPLDNQHVLVVYDDSTIVGFACAFIEDDETYGSLLDNIHVKPSFHKRGLGKKLLNSIANQCFQVAPSLGFYLWVLQNNTNAQDFYLAQGASNLGTDVWDAPGGTIVPRFRFGWSAGKLPMS